MAHNIIRHRRGTESDWKRLNLVPEEGEIIIVEFKDGSRECKIGDGIRPFKELSYLGEDFKNYILSAIENIQNSIDSRFINISNDISSLGDTLENKILSTETAINGSIINITTITEEKFNIVNSSLHTIETNLNTLTLDTNNKLQVLEDNITDKESGLKQEIKSASKLFDSKLEQTNNYVAILQKTIDDLASATSASIATIQSKDAQQDLKVSEIEQNIHTLDKSISDTNDTINTLNIAAKKKLDNIKADLDSDISVLRESVNELSIDVYDKIDNQTESFDTDLETKASQITADYTAKISAIEQTIQASIESSDKKHTKAINNLQTAVDNRFNTADAALFEKLTILKTELVAADNLLTETINKLSEQNNTFSAETLDKIAELYTKIKTLDEQDASLYLDIIGAKRIFENTAANLSSDVAEVKQLRLDDKIYTLSEISRLEEAHNVSYLDLTNMLLDYVAKIYAEIADLVDDDVDTIIRLFATEAKLKQKIDTDIEALDDKQTQAINLVQTNLNENVEAITSDIAELTRNTEEITSSLSKSIKDNYSTLDSKIDEVNKNLTDSIETTNTFLTDRLNSNYDTLTESLNNFRAEVEAQDKNILDTVNNVKTELQAELHDTDINIRLEIADTVSNINTELNSLDEAIHNDISSIDNKLSEKIVQLDDKLEENVQIINNTIESIAADDPDADGTSTTFISTVKQVSGKIIATKSNLPVASADTSGIVKLGIESGAATYERTEAAHKASETNATKIAEIKNDYLRCKDNQLYVGAEGADVVIFDCGGIE